MIQSSSWSLYHAARDQPRLTNRELRKYASLLPLARFLTLLMPEMSKPNYSVDLPLLGTQPPQLLLPVQKVAPNPVGATPQSRGVRRRHVLNNPPTESTRTENQKSEAVEGDPGDTFTFVVRDGRTVRHERRQKELLEILEPVLVSDDSNSSSILLCWGNKNRCRIIPVKIPDSADDVAIWQEIQRAWYAHRGGWRKRLGIFSVRRVDIVEVRPVHRASKIAVRR
jgi:hypothetical protein